jgi:hypothetical protein
MLFWIVPTTAGFALVFLVWGMPAAITAATYFVVFLLGFCFRRTSYMLSLIKFEERHEESRPPWPIDLREPD